MLESGILDEMGGFETLQGELIDDCALARKVKSMGCMTWMGLSHSVTSLRAHDDLPSIWNMVARTAFTQLRTTVGVLFGCDVDSILGAGSWSVLAWRHDQVSGGSQSDRHVSELSTDAQVLWAVRLVVGGHATHWHALSGHDLDLSDKLLGR